jgi:hypothetical protein
MLTDEADDVRVVLKPNSDTFMKLVNGSPGLVDCLTFRDGVVPATLAAALLKGGYAVATLYEPPLSVIVRVGSKGGAEQPLL